MRKSAILSPNGQYRYRLSRHWGDEAMPIIFIMLNPSTADAEVDDATIRRCCTFAGNFGFGGIRVLNLFAYRATDPKQLRAVVDPVGPDNDKHLNEALDWAGCIGGTVCAAWGVHGTLNGRDDEVIALAASHGVKLMCLGQTRGGHPMHPLYLPGNSKLVEML